MPAITILHISDLHRDPFHGMTNQALLDSLERDRDRYRVENPAIPDPDVIIVSGDVVHGVSPEAKDAVAELNRQYAEAERFLVSLTDSFVDGDRERVVVIPGNHDISYYHTLQSMKLIEVSLGSQKGRAAAVAHGRRLNTPGSPIRWSWSGFCFYEITDFAIYNSRLEAFCGFYERFYNGKRHYSLKPEEQFDIFDYPDYNIGIAGLSSCYENDPLNKQGAIHPDSIAAAARRLCEPQYRDRLLLAVWHHNTSGGPEASDYVDADILQVLIDDGFSIGFHGHQHKSQFIEEWRQFGGARKITVVSAGTLCAGPRELPTGHTRAYNLLQIDVQALKATLHQRRMQNRSFDRPIWGPGQFLSSGTSFVQFNVEVPVKRDHKTADAKLMGSAEELLRNGRHAEAVKLLKPIVPFNALAKKLLWECYVADGDGAAMIADFYPPETEAEIVYLADALWEAGARVRLEQMLERPNIRDSIDPSVVMVREKYKVRLTR